MRPDDLIAGFARLADEAASEELSARENTGLRRLELALAMRKTAHRRAAAWRWIGSGAAAAAVAACALLVWRPTTLTYEVTRGRVSEGGYIVPVSAGASVRFSDQSELDLEQGTRLRVSHLEPQGASMMLEGGVLHVHITPRRHASWAIDAGPYVVHVTGTEFDLAWKVDDQTLDLDLHRGSVTVDGPAANGGIHMRAGQRLTAHAGDGSLSIVDGSGNPASPEGKEPSRAKGVGGAPSSPSGEPSDAVPAAGVTAAEASGSSAAASLHASKRGKHADESGGSWAARVSRGDFQSVLESAEERGIEATAAEAPLSDISALADAARYARRPDVARRALTAERTRFPGSVQARDAAFFLGGLAEAEGDATVALDWYETYARESPAGSYAPQALGRTIALVQQVRGASDARSRAGEYLRRFPGGPYAPYARKLLQMQ